MISSVSLSSKEVERLGKYNDLILNYKFKYKEDFLPTEYEYYLDEDDLEFLLDLICDQFGIHIDGAAYKILNFLNNFSDKLCAKEPDQVLWTLQDYLDDEPIKNQMIEHCYEKAKEEFPEAFEYWVEEEDYPEFLDTSDWEELE